MRTQVEAILPPSEEIFLNWRQFSSLHPTKGIPVPTCGIQFRFHDQSVRHLIDTAEDSGHLRVLLTRPTSVVYGFNGMVSYYGCAFPIVLA